MSVSVSCVCVCVGSCWGPTLGLTLVVTRDWGSSCVSSVSPTSSSLVTSKGSLF